MPSTIVTMSVTPQIYVQFNARWNTSLDIMYPIDETKLKNRLETERKWSFISTKNEKRYFIFSPKYENEKAKLFFS